MWCVCPATHHVRNDDGSEAAGATKAADIKSSKFRLDAGVMMIGSKTLEFWRYFSTASDSNGKAQRWVSFTLTEAGR